jgi:hypothetical protein
MGWSKYRPKQERDFAFRNTNGYKQFKKRFIDRTNSDIHGFLEMVIEHKPLAKHSSGK